MFSEQVINEILFDFIEGGIAILLYTLLIGERDFIKKNKIKALIFILFYTSFTYWATTYIPKGIHSLFVITFLIIVLSFITQSKIYASIILIAIHTILLAFMEAIGLGIVSIIYKAKLNTILDQPNQVLFTSIISKFLFLFLVITLFKLKISLLKKDFYKRENSVLYFIILQMFMTTLIFVNIIFMIMNKEYTFTYSSLIIFMFLLLIILAFFDYRERERIMKIQGRFDAQVEHVRNMEQIMSTVRKEKHDFSNHMNTIQLMCKMNTPDTLEKIEAYIAKLTTGLKSAYRFYNTGNDYINCLLAVKSSYAFEHDIRLNVDFQAPLSEVQIEDNDLISVMGNIVDNAFDAATSQPDRTDRAVSISGYAVDAKYYLSISNNGPMIGEKDLERIFENGYSTKSAKKADHGFGLYIAKQHVTRNKGQIVVSSSEDETRFLVILNLKEQACEKAS